MNAPTETPSFTRGDKTYTLRYLEDTEVWVWEAARGDWLRHNGEEMFTSLEAALEKGRLFGLVVEAPEFTVERELVRPDLDDSDIRFTATDADDAQAIVDLRPAGKDWRGNPRAATITAYGSSDTRPERARALIAALEAALAEAGVTER